MGALCSTASDTSDAGEVEEQHNHKLQSLSNACGLDMPTNIAKMKVSNAGPEETTATNTTIKDPNTFPPTGDIETSDSQSSTIKASDVGWS
jgi:hypothetical protein